MHFLRIFILALTLLNDSTASAYNFLYIHPTTGQPIRWDNAQPIRYYLDPGLLGRLTNDQAHTLLKEAMKIWENASPDADVPRFEFAGNLPEDIDGTNYSNYVGVGVCYEDDLSACPTEAQRNLQTVIIFDNDGTILENELCKIRGCSASAGARVIDGSSSSPGNIRQGIFVLGRFAGSESTRISAVMGQMVHELGHLLGLAHTSINEEIYINDNAELGNLMSTMLAGSVPRSGTGSERIRLTLHPDDIAGISVLYPSGSFAGTTATIKGEIFKSDGSPMMHVNMIARNIEDSLCEAYSFLSGRLCKHTPIGEVCIDDSGLAIDNGEYVISGLPLGSYTLEVEEVADDNLAFTLAPGLVDPFILGDAEFWNEGDAANEPNTLSSTITLAAGETRENVNIILNRSEVTDDRVKYLPLDTFTPGPGTRCPEEPPIDYAELIGIEEGGDSAGTSDTTDSGSAGGCSLVR